MSTVEAMMNHQLAAAVTLVGRIDESRRFRRETAEKSIEGADHEVRGVAGGDSSEGGGDARKGMASGGVEEPAGQGNQYHIACVGGGEAGEHPGKYHKKAELGGSSRADEASQGEPREGRSVPQCRGPA